jgi:hypothetical protein
LKLVRNGEQLLVCDRDRLEIPNVDLLHGFILDGMTKLVMSNLGRISPSNDTLFMNKSMAKRQIS